MAGNSGFLIAFLKKYIRDTADGLGAVKGASAKIKSIQTTGTGSTVTFSWTGSDGQELTEDMPVRDAYGIAVANGFSGSQIDWLASLKGAPGSDAQVPFDEIGHGLKIDIQNKLVVDMANDDFSGDNSLPISAAAVRTTVGNIEALLNII